MLNPRLLFWGLPQEVDNFSYYKMVHNLTEFMFSYLSKENKANASVLQKLFEVQRQRDSELQEFLDCDLQWSFPLAVHNVTQESCCKLLTIQVSLKSSFHYES